MICSRCKRELDPATDDRWTLPKDGGVETVCTQCKKAPTLPAKIIEAIEKRRKG